MSTIGFAGMVKDVAAARELSKELSGPRKADYVAALKRQGCVKERVYLVETPMGHMNLVYRDAPNAGFAMAALAASSNAFDKFFLESVSKIAGVDLSKIPAGP